MIWTDPTIDQYCTRQSTPVSESCEEIADYTRSHEAIPQMLIGPLEGSFLGFLVGLTGAKRILEIGCFTGYSALAMAERLPPDGELVTLDINPETTQVAETFWAKSPHGQKIRSRIGPALESIDAIEGKFDMAFIDADKQNYLNYFKRVLGLLNHGGLVVLDNCLYGGLAPNPPTSDKNAMAVHDFNRIVASYQNLETVLLPIRDGVMLVRKK